MLKGLLLRLYRDLKGDVFAIPGRTIALVFAVSLLVLPLFSQDPYLLRVIVFASIFAIFAASWDLLTGFVGQMNLGHALFFGVAAYGSALINVHVGLSPWITIILGALIAVLTGLLVGLPALRLRGVYLSLVTLAFPIILTGIIFVFSDLTGGELGLSGFDRLASSRLQEYYIAVLAMLILCFTMWKITDSKLGIIFHAIREDEIAARASGINTTRYKLLAFSLSGFFAGIAGAMYVHTIGVAGPSTLEIFMSFQAIIWAIFGGIGTIYGAVAGVFILFPAMEVLRLVPEWRMLLFAVMIVLVLRYMPQGLTRYVLDKLEIKCPRCKAVNAFTRQHCRVCLTVLREQHEQKKMSA
ncbi:ABC-type transporter, integral membrane subunit [Caldalkalibacillus thermarum TA2.A1]|uniref:ABC-type transporter, integral membrane subunit n=1 Tax=Caldalkalibacillus thermarum (strain TA2.A1) TaxID=986075 RepID=F5L6T1_CALTT|nr:branched-chain amino acid ABC transporter permease [Caldalkalibacillus thermarum]EGL82974.1 ABC-type transporter, integral membrane subunit [Caldalkalibacillus thermarum TA2.A1]